MAIQYADGSSSNNGRQISSHYASYDTLLNMSTNSGVNILTINVTPKSNNSRFLITASCSWSASNNDCYINVRRDSNSIEMSGDSSNRTKCHFGCHYNRSQFDQSRETVVLRDHPNTASQVSYQVLVYRSGGSNGNLYVNRNQHNDNREFDPAGICFLIVEEFAP